MPDANGQYTESDVLFDMRYEGLHAGGGLRIQANLGGLVATEMISQYEMYAAGRGLSLSDMVFHTKRRLAQQLLYEWGRAAAMAAEVRERQQICWSDVLRSQYSEWRVVDMPPTPVSTMEYRMEYDPKYREFCEWDQEGD